MLSFFHQQERPKCGAQAEVHHRIFALDAGLVVRAKISLIRETFDKADTAESSWDCWWRPRLANACSCAVIPLGRSVWWLSHLQLCTRLSESFSSERVTIFSLQLLNFYCLNFTLKISQCNRREVEVYLAIINEITYQNASYKTRRLSRRVAGWWRLQCERKRWRTRRSQRRFQRRC